MSTRLEHDEFVPYAPDEPGTVHIHHCKTGNNNDRLYITRKDDDSIVAYCHHCGASGGFNVLGNRVIKASERNKTDAGPGDAAGDELHVSDAGTDGQGTGEADAATTAGTGSVQPGFVPTGNPEIDVKDWPMVAQEWWFEYGLTITQSHEAGAMYYPDDEVLAYTHLGGTQFRFFGKTTGLKYRTSPNLSRLNVSLFRPSATWLCHDLLNMSHIPTVLVEDFRSAMKVSNFVPAIALGGTRPSPEFLAEYTKLRGPGASSIIVWLDNDNAQVNKDSLATARRFSALGYDTVRVTEKTCKADPKELTWSGIREVLDTACAELSSGT